MSLSNEVLVRLFDASPHPCLVLDRQLNIVTANQAWLAAMQRAPGDIVGRVVGDAFPADQDIRRQLSASIERVFRTGQADTMAPLRTNGDGSESRWWTITHAPLLDAGGEVELVLQHPLEVTGTERARQLPQTTPQLQEVERRLAFQLELADRLRPLDASVDAIGAASALLGQHLGPARVVFAEVAPLTMAVTVRRDWCRPGIASVAGTETTVDNFGPGITDELRLGRNVLVADVDSDARTASHAADYRALGIRAHMTIPLTRGGQVRALLSLHDTRPRAWSLEEQRMAQDMAERTWAAVEAADAQAALRAERDQSQYIFDSMTEGFGLIDREWTIVRMNATGLQMVQRSAKDVIGRNHWDVFPEADGTELARICRSVKDSGQAASVEYAYPLPDGELRWMEVRVFPAMHGGIAVFFRDVSSRRSAEDRLRRTAEHLRFTLDAARLGDWDMDLLTGATRRSLRHDECFGYREPVCEWSAEIFLAHVHPDDRERVGHEFRWALTEGRSWRTETRVVWPDGSVHWLAILGTVYAEQGGPQRMAGIVFDISERKLAEEQLRLEASRKDEFLAMLAHELRNPLAPIGAAADLLVMGGLDPVRMRRTSAIIKRQVSHMSSLIDDLLDVSRVTRGLVTLERGPVDVKATVADAVEQVRPLMEARRHRLEVILAPEHALVEGDRKRLVQVLANLLGNAAKYTPEGGRIVLEMEVESRDPPRVMLRVIDNGIGMSAAMRDAAFELFTQAERTSDRSQGGLGIGLALVKSLVELHGGLVAVHSDGPGLGSRFTVCLPRMPERQSAGPGGLAARQDQPLPAARSRLVMIVDDNLDAAQLLAMVLENLGHEVVVESDPHRALETAARRTPAVGILDIGLPEMDGNELARRLRALPGMADALLIAVTGYGRPEDRERALAAGFDHHLVKPVDVHALAALLGEDGAA